MHELTPQDVVRLLWESNEEEDKGSHAAIFEVKFGKKVEGSFIDSRERTADTLFSDLESVASVVEGSDFKDNFVLTAYCIRDAKERQLVTRSGFQRIRCCVCHLHHEREMTAPDSVRKFFKTALQQVYNLEVDVIAGDANAVAYKFYRKQEYQDLHNSSVAVMLREAHLKADFLLIIIPIITFLSFAQQVILTVASWLFSHEENHLDP